MVNLLDFEDYAANCLFIRTKEGEVTKFKLWPTQKVILDAIEEMRKEGKPPRIVILKARQQGISSFCVAYAFWSAVTQPNYNAVVIAHNRETSRRLLELAGYMYDMLPDNLRPMRRYRSKDEILFENPDEKERSKNPGLRSRIEIKTAGLTVSGRGLTIHGLHCSELASYKDPDSIVSSLLPAVPDNLDTFVIFESTSSLEPAAVWFKEFWDSANEGNTPFRALFIPWFANPEYRLPPRQAKRWLLEPLDDYEQYLMRVYKVTKEQIAWRRMKITTFPRGERQFGVEFPAEPHEVFLSAGDPFLPSEVSKKLTLSIRHPIAQLRITDLRPDIEGDLHVWEMPREGAYYVVGVDVGGGTTSSYSAIQVIEVDLPNYKQVARARLNIDPVQLVDRIIKVARLYNEAMVSVETNSVGVAVVSMLSDKGYWKQFRWRYLDTGEYTKKLGWNTTASTKPLMMQHLLHLLTVGALEVPDRRTVEELVRLLDDGRGSGVAPPGFTDDLVMALSIAVYTGWLERKGLAASVVEPEGTPAPSGWTIADLVPKLVGVQTDVY